MPIQVKLKYLFIYLLLSGFYISDTSGQSASDIPNNVFLKAKGTGNTTGHIANITVTNNSNEDLNTSIGPFYVPSDGQYQPYIIPTPIQIVAKANQETIVEVIGYCTDPNLPTPPAGHSLVPIDQWNTGSPLIPITKSIINHTVRLQESGQIITPLNNNPSKERDAVIQQTLWWYSVGPAYNPCDQILRSLSDNFRDTDWFSGNVSELEQLPQPLVHDFFAMPTANPWFAVLKRNLYGEKIYNALSQGIAQFADAISKVGQAAGLADFTKPSLPYGVGQPKDASQPSNPQIFSTIKVTGTGRTTGHIASLSVSNPTKEPINVKIGNGGSFLIPSSGPYQPYVVPSIPAIPVQPGKTVTVPVEGYCVDIRRPPVGPDIPMPPVQSWIESTPQSITEVSVAPQIPEPFNPPVSNTMEVTLPTKMAISLQEATNILQSLPPPAPMRNWNCPDLVTDNSIFIPGTDHLMPININVDDMPGLAAPLLLDAINRITHAIDKLDMDGVINTPFSNNKDKERESVIQQTFWMYSAGLSGQAYTKNDFENNTIKQFETTTGKNYGDIPVNQKDQIDKGVDDFWNTFSAVGVEAKILPKPVPPTNDPIRKEMEDAFGGMHKSNIKINEDKQIPSIGAKASTKGDSVIPNTGTNPDPSLLGHEAAHVIQQSSTPTQTLPENLDFQSNEVEREPMARPANTSCDCKEMTFNLVVKGQNTDRNKKRDNRPVSSGQESLTESENEKVLIFDDWSQGDYFTINFNTFKMKCDCQNAGVVTNVECDFFPGKNKSTVTDKGRIKLESKPEKIDKTVFEIVSENDGAGQKYEYKYTPQKDQPDSFTFCFSAYCKSDKCNEKENEKSCGPYCITLKFRKRE
ncbi:MAG: DUF4157 domain-containing protein [Saprospiraceae bacterium]|nr:DUF4157 domain-containing protein [Saprospiraceae bacterium]